MSFQIAFAGTPEFAAVALQAVLDAAPQNGWSVPLVLTQPDRPAGRGMKLQASPVKVVAQKYGLELCQPTSLRRDGAYAQEAEQAYHALTAARPDVWVVAAYGLLLPQWALSLPRLGCLNIHGSLLPRWRGAAPIQRAIEAGDEQSGVGIMQMELGLDTGPVWIESRLSLSPSETASSLHDRLAALGAQTLVQALQCAQRGWTDAAGQTLQPHVQDLNGITYASKISKAEAQLDWSLSAAVLERRVRAFDPFPGAVTTLNQASTAQQLKVWAAQCLDVGVAPGVAGEVLALNDAGFDVRCGSESQGYSVLRVTQMQKPGGKRQPAGGASASLGLSVGQVFAAH